MICYVFISYLVGEGPTLSWIWHGNYLYLMMLFLDMAAEMSVCQSWSL